MIEQGAEYNLGSKNLQIHISTIVQSNPEFQVEGKVGSSAINTTPHLCFLTHKPLLGLLLSCIEFVVAYCSSLCFWSWQYLAMERHCKHQLGLVCVMLLSLALCTSQDFTPSRATYYGSPDCYGNPSTSSLFHIMIVYIVFDFCSNPTLLCSLLACIMSLNPYTPCVLQARISQDTHVKSANINFLAHDLLIFWNFYLIFL